MPEFLGLVVLYHPDEDVTRRVKTYIEEVSALLIVDNTELRLPVLDQLKELDSNVTIISNAENTGIAHALNQGVDFGLAHKFDWILTMDQDSEFEPGALHAMKQFVLQSEPELGIVSPFHHTPGARKAEFTSPTKKL